MMQNPYFLEILAKERQNDFIREAEAYRMARQAKQGHCGQIHNLKHLLARLGGLQIGSGRPQADAGTTSKDKTFTEAYS